MFVTLKTHRRALDELEDTRDSLRAYQSRYEAALDRIKVLETEAARAPVRGASGRFAPRAA